MLRSITLQLTDETLNRAQEIADKTGTTLEEILSSWLNHTAISPVLDYFTPNAEYPVYTPFDNYEAAQQLQDYLEAVQKSRRKESGDNT